MTGLLSRAAAAFVEPAPAEVAPAATALPHGARALVLGRPVDAVALAAALAGELRARERAAAALLVTWPCEPPRPAPASRPARGLAARLDSRGLEAVARGRLAWLALSGSPAAAAAATLRAEAATAGPTVVAVTGPRCGAFDALLDECDVVVVVLPPGADPALSELALAGLAACRAPVIACPPLSGASMRLLALAGRGRMRHAPSAPAAGVAESLR